MKFQGFPFSISWELTRKTNLHDIYSDPFKGKPRSNELTRDEAMKILYQFSPLLVQDVTFSGGEPFLSPYWYELLLKLYELGIHSRILTNATLLNKETVQRLHEVHTTGVVVQIDGLSTTHDTIHGCDGLFTQVIEGLAKLLSARIPLSVRTDVTRLNIRELPSLFSFLHGHGVRSWILRPISPLDCHEHSEALILSDELYLKFGEFAADYTPRARKLGFFIEPANSLGYFTEMEIRDQSWTGCPAGLTTLSITSDGKVKGCPNLSDEFVEGDLRKQDLWDIWFHPNTFAYTRHFSPEDLSGYCAKCVEAEHCHGGCVAMSYGSTKKLHGDPFCFMRLKENSHSKNHLSKPIRNK